MEGTVEDANIGLHAKLIKRFLVKTMPLIQKNNAVMVVLNHVKVNFMAYGTPEYTPGGKSLEHNVSVRLRTKYLGKIKEGDKVTAIKIKMEVTKNKVGKPFGITEMDFDFEKGFISEPDYIGMGLDKGVLRKEGNTIYFGDIKLGVGKAKAGEALKEDESLAAKLEELL